MFFVIGLVIVIGSILGGYMPHGDIMVLWQPLEVLIIVGSAIGGFIIANPMPLIKATMKGVGRVLKTPPHNKDSYLELLTLQYTIFRTAKAKGMLALEQHIENPEESTLFQAFPKFYANKHSVDFVCDYLRMMSIGADKPHEMEALFDEEIETHHAEGEAVSAAIIAVAESLPALGIVAAVLGVIVTMGSITEPPEVLGKLIGGALVGTFIGVLLSYGIVGPMGRYLEAYDKADGKYFLCIKAGLLAHMQGHAPAVSIEFARKTLFSHERPSFFEVEEAIAEARPV